ncbi:MAG: hypothetical protein H0T09_07005 [Actinobacteria bacterium]|nr:hypothetical protein [Actinomycetota bacterium]
MAPVARLRTLLAGAALALVLAAAGLAIDIYMTASVSGRVPGRNAAHVTVRWDFKCLGDRLGPATYSYAIQLVRRLPKPERAIPVATGTSKSGSRRVQLGPGRYDLLADPFKCETERGAGSAEPEAGRPVVVPDYCAWSVASRRGRVGVERGGAALALGRGSIVRPGDLAFTTARARLALRSTEGGSLLRLAGDTRLRIDRRHCGRHGGWRLDAESGSVQSRLAERDRARRYEVRSENAVTSAARATWTVEARERAGRPWTRVVVQSGRVSVRNARSRKAIVLGAGRSVVVAGSGAPSR